MLEVDPSDTNYVDGKEYFFNITHLDIGTHTYKFWTSDGVMKIDTPNFNGPTVYNTQPTITTSDNLTAIEDSYYEVHYEYEDIDVVNVGQAPFWNYSTNASWLSFDNVTAILNGTPTNDDVGTYWVNISINDTMEFDFTNFTLNVVNVNDDPIINITNIEITYEDELYEVDYNATDVDSPIANQVWSLDTNATTWLGIDSATGVISGTPTNDDVGEYWVNVSVVDGDGGDAYETYTLIVMNVNDRPEITTADVLTTNADILYSVDYNATDIDSPLSQFSWALATNGTWLEIDAVTGILSGTPTNADAGWYNVNVTVDDGDGGQDWHEFIVTVIHSGVIINLPPMITTTDVVSATAGEMYYVDYNATDDRTPLDLLTWQLNTDASWLSIVSSTGVLSGTPIISDVGDYWVNITVGDGEGGSDFHNFTLTVYSEANNPPEIITEDDKNAIVGELYSVDYEANDDRTPVNNLQWSLETNASWLSIGKNSGVLSGTPNATDVGSYWVKISVFDGEDGWDFTNFTLWVTTEEITEFPPELSNPSVSPTTGDTNTDFTFSVDYSHPDDEPPDVVKVVIDGIANEMSLVGDHYEFTTKLTEGNHSFYFTTTLGEFTVNTGTFNIGPITKATVGPDDGDEKDDEEDNTWLFALIGVIIVVIIVLMLLFVFLKKKKREEEPPVEVPAPAPPAEVPPEQVPVQEPPAAEQPPVPEAPPEPAPAPKTPPSEHPPQPEQVPAPAPDTTPQPPPEQPVPPEVTPQPVAQPQAEPAPTSQPAPVPPVAEPQQPQVPKIKQEPSIEE
jgi:hypothetical protein